MGFDDHDTLADMEDADLSELGMPPHHIARFRSALRQILGVEANPVTVFLRQFGLEQYSDRLIAAGVDELETLVELDDMDLKDLGFIRGHALKLRRRIRQHLTGVDSKQDFPHTSRISLAEPSEIREGMVSECPTDRTQLELPNLADMEKEVSDVVQSWGYVEQLGIVAAGAIFCKHTFALAPEAMALFPPSVLDKYSSSDSGFEELADLDQSTLLTRHFSVVLNAVGSAVAGLQQDLSVLVSMVQQLGGRHAGYGVEAPHFEVIGQALKLTLEEILADRYTPEVDRAWGIVYNFLSMVMIHVMRDARASPEIQNASNAF